MGGNKYKAYLEIVGEIIKDYAFEAKMEKDKAVGASREHFATGYLNGFYRVVTVMQQHAELFDIPLKELSLDIDEFDLI